jgi:hypothetical protein
MLSNDAQLEGNYLFPEKFTETANATAESLEKCL